MKRFARRLEARLAGCSRLVAVGHYAAVPAAITIVAMRVTLTVTGSHLACYAASMPLLLLLPALGAHACGICPRGSCGAVISASPAALAESRRWWLLHAHRPFASAILWALIAVWAILTFVVPIPVASAVPVIAGMLIELRAARLHSALQPWCPRCGHGGVKHLAPAGAAS